KVRRAAGGRRRIACNVGHEFTPTRCGSGAESRRKSARCLRSRSALGLCQEEVVSREMANVLHVETEIGADVALDGALHEHVAVLLHKVQFARLVVEVMGADE